nr:sortase [Bifidobacterium catenulatum]
MFDKLNGFGMKAELGDLFHIDSAGRTLTYKVVSINVVTPDDFTGLKIEPGCDLVTFLTCTPYGITTTVSSSQANVPPYRKQWKNNVRSTYVRPSYALCHRLLGHRFRCRVGHTRP